MSLEAFSSAGYGDVLVVDNGGRADEACVGDLVVLEAQAAGVGGVVGMGAAPRHAGSDPDRPAGVQLRPLPGWAGPPR